MDTIAKIRRRLGHCPGGNRVWAEAIGMGDYGLRVRSTGPNGRMAYLAQCAIGGGLSGVGRALAVRTVPEPERLKRVMPEPGQNWGDGGRHLVGGRGGSRGRPVHRVLARRLHDDGQLRIKREAPGLRRMEEELNRDQERRNLLRAWVASPRTAWAQLKALHLLEMKGKTLCATV